MLYKVYETQRTLMEPFVDFAQAAAKVYGNPLTPLGKNPFAQRVAAGYSLLYRLGKEPRRLWRRYLVTNTLFVWGALRQLWAGPRRSVQ